ncbi:MAG: DMT family transporter [Thermoplasmataceae archaeon]
MVITSGYYEQKSLQGDYGSIEIAFRLFYKQHNDFSKLTNGNRILGPSSAIAAAFIWATYYTFIYYANGFSQILIFSIPALAGSSILILPLAIRRRSLVFLFDKGVFITGVLYFAEQFTIIISSERNGPVLTSLFVLFGDAIVSPLLSIVLRVNSVHLKYLIFALSLLITVPSSAALVLNGSTLVVPNISGILLLVGVTLFVPALFIALNILISQKGSEYALSGTFFWPGLVTLFIGLSGILPTVAVLKDLPGFSSLLFTGFTSMGLAYFMFFESSRRNGFAIASVLQALIPVFTLLTIHFTENVTITSLESVLLISACVGASISIFSVKQFNNENSALYDLPGSKRHKT